jgi:peptidoglycan hydrolase-like protein with peptidoglycan-binding domain
MTTAPALAQNDDKSVLQLSTQLGVGARGDLVKILQSILASDPSVLDSKYVTGYFGPITKSAVQKFQKKFNIESVGRVGPKTLQKVNELLASSPVTTSQTANGTTCAFVPPGHLIAPGYLKKTGGVPTVSTCQILPPGILKKISGGWTGGGGSDTTAPIISNVVVSGISTTSASLSFKTDEDTVFEVMYGPTTTYGTTSAKSTVFEKNHTFAWSGLSPYANYHYQIKVYDRAGNITTSSDNTFMTSASDTTAPTISGVTIGAMTTSGATIYWMTNEPATSEVYYGTTASYGSSSVDTTLSTIHSSVITGLNANTLYHYQIKSKDGAGNIATSSDATFTTNAIPDTTAPIISAVSVGSITSTTANVTFTTNENAIGKIYWNTSTPVNKSTASSATTVSGTSHTASLSGLTANTTYYYLIEATDASNNMSTSSEGAFTTLN